MTRVLTGARWSAVARCVRQGCYSALGVEERPPSEDERRYFARGHMFEDLVSRQLEERYGPENVVRQPEVEWEHGVAHPDLYVRPEKLIVEIKSAVSPSLESFEHAVRQVRGYVHFHPEAEAGAIYVINPSHLRREELLPVVLEPEHRVEVEASVAAVGAAIRSRGSELPERVCRVPGDARKRLCPFAETCFQDWVAPAPQEVDTPAARVAAVEVFHADERVRQLKAQVKEAEAQRDVARALAVDAGVPVGDSRVGNLIVKRTVVRGRRSFQFEKALTAGVISEDLVAPFVSVGSESERWTLRREGEGPLVLPDDFGEVPFG